eukprot:Nk52_evm11s367 gene=Nk52_evmTU11s367
MSNVFELSGRNNRSYGRLDDDGATDVILDNIDDSADNPDREGRDSFTAGNNTARRSTSGVGGPRHVSSAFRTVYINWPEKNEVFEYCSNSISTAKYTIWWFLPKFLFEQFSRYANLFFLLMSIFQQIPGVSPSGQFTTLVPLLCVLTATAIKEIVEDYARHRSDDEVNNRKVKVIREGTFMTLKWTQVRVGDVVRVIDNQFFPADLVLLSSSEPQGMCYIETANLDGETNLKLKQALPQTSYLTSPREARSVQGVVECEQPNQRLYNFDGNITLEGGQSIPLSNEQILLRGAQLKNTPWIYGLVIFTGHESKLMQNSTAAPIKRSNVEEVTNFQIIFMFVWLAAMALFSAIAGWVELEHEGESNLWYLMYGLDGPQNFFLNFLTFCLLYQNLIPISLVIMMEVAKYIQAFYINHDEELYYEKKNVQAVARTSNLNEELGQVQYIFSDKTGTLTQNQMVFKKASVAGVMYGSSDPDLDDFEDPALIDNLTSGHPTASVIREYLTLIGVCHTVIPEKDKINPDRISYQCASPDEAALVKAVKQLGFSFNVRTPESVLLNVLGQDQKFEILNVLEFNSTRKRMSVIVRSPQGTIKLFCKGADNVIYERLAANQPFADATMKHLEEFASEGLRTLCLGVTEIPEEEYKKWNDIYHRAATSLVNREDEIDKAAELIEKNLFLLGATAIEDKLQEQVPETIVSLLDAGIKLWVLTGDKQETAINVGFACRLLNDKMTILVCNSETRSEARDYITGKLEELSAFMGKQNDGLALVIDGHTLGLILESELELDFLRLAKMCKSVVCCRVSPLQKAQVVRLMKRHEKAITLAVGDGANDVAMIQAAHVGIGISGEEGLQAARSSDYSVARFFHLRRLLLVHGALSYRRLSKLVLFSFYKNIALYLVQFWFAFYNVFSGQILFERWTIGFYNILFTALPPLAIGAFDMHVSIDNLMRVPQLYQVGPKGQFFNVQVFWFWAINAVFHSAVCFYMGLGMYDNDVVKSNGTAAGLWVMGTTVYTYVLLTVIGKFALVIGVWTVWCHVAAWGSVLVWFIYLMVYGSIFNGNTEFASEVYQIQWYMFSSGVFWFSLFVVPVFALTRDFTWKAVQRNFFPKNYHIIQEMTLMHADPNLIKSAFSLRSFVQKIPVLDRFISHGFAFSAGERGQAEFIRKYDTNIEKPEG